MNFKHLLIVGLTIITLSGCFNEEITCTDESVKKLVEEIVIPEIKESLKLERIKKENLGHAMLYATYKRANMDIGTFMKGDKLAAYQQTLNTAQNDVNEIFEGYKFALINMRTTNKDKELHKVSCSGTAQLTFAIYPEDPVDTGISYNAQLSDDMENVYVEVTEME